MKNLILSLCSLSISASAFAGWIPAYGVTCSAKNGATVELYPNADETMIQLVISNAKGQVIADNNHKIIEIRHIGSMKRYKIEGFVEMDQTATFSMQEENLKDASFVFNQSAQEDLGLPKVFANCDVL